LEEAPIEGIVDQRSGAAYVIRVDRRMLDGVPEHAAVLLDEVRVPRRRVEDQLDRLRRVADVELAGGGDERRARLSVRQAVKLVVGEHALGVGLCRSQ